jgi:hypothetical protein
VIAVVGFFVTRYIVNTINGKIEQYTETAPMKFPTVDISADELKSLQERLARFDKDSEAHTNTPPLVLTGREINALLANSPDFKEYKDKCYIDIDGDKVKGEVSLPLEKYFKVPLVNFKGRYLNGAGQFKVGVSNHKLSVYVLSLEVKGKPLPEDFMAQLRGKDMAAEIANSQTNRPKQNNNLTNANVSRYESIDVKDGTVTLKAKTD